MNGLSVRRHRVKCRPTVLCANYVFSHTDSASNTSGLNNWKRAFKAASHHEKGREHTKCMMTYYGRLMVSGHNRQFNTGCQYWKEVLKRTIVVIRFFSIRRSSFKRAQLYHWLSMKRK